jgi:hypothetical protein
MSDFWDWLYVRSLAEMFVAEQLADLLAGLKMANGSRRGFWTWSSWPQHMSCRYKVKQLFWESKIPPLPICWFSFE